jgi:hypothetical protein
VVQKGFQPDRCLLLALAKELIAHIASISFGKWDHWREDWVVIRADVHDRLALLTESPTTKKSG